MRSLGHGTPTDEFIVFLSSAQDARPMRERVAGLIEHAVNQALEEAGSRQRLRAYRWEYALPRRFEDDESIDTEFVDRAVRSHLVLALAVDRLGFGTQAEIDAVLQSKTAISLVWFAGEDDRRRQWWRDRSRRPLERYMKHLESSGQLRFRRAGRPGSDSSWEAIVHVLFAAVLASSMPQKERLDEER